MVRYLIIRLSSIGDIVLTTPVVRCLKKQGDNPEIHYLTKKEFEPLLIKNPYIDKIHTFNGDLFQTIKTLRVEHFDYIIDLHNNIRTFIIKNRLRHIDFSLNKLNIKKWLLTSFGIDRLPDVHLVDRYMETLNLFEIENDEKGLDYFIPVEDEVDISGFPDPFLKGYVVFSIGGKHNTKKMPAEKIANICNLMNLPVMLAGGEEDRETAEEIRKLSGDFVFNACGKYNINQSASLIRQSKLVLTHDTGLMHIAGAFKKNIISIWGSTDPRFGMYPYCPGNYSRIFEVPNLKCRPCSKLGFRKCPRKHFKCMTEHDESEIAGYARELFSISMK